MSTMILSPEIGCAYGFPFRRLPHPQVAPAEPPITPLLGHHGLAVGPNIEEHQRRVGYAPRRESGKHVWVLVKGMIDVVILVDGEVGTDTGLVSPRVNPITDEVHHRLVRLVGLPIPQHRKRPPWHCVAGPPSLDVSLRRLLELDRGKTPGVGHTLVSPQDCRCVLKLCRGKRIKRMSDHERRILSSAGPRSSEMLTVELRQARYWFMIA